MSAPKVPKPKSVGLVGIAGGATRKAARAEAAPSSAAPAPKSPAAPKPRRISQGPEVEITSAAAYGEGDVIGSKYMLTRLLGEGGMGAVWLARNLTLDVDVAVKLIRRDLAGPETARRLLQEARAAARIGHASIVRIFDFGETEYQDPFIVMEHIQGESLREVLERKGRLPAANAVSMLLPVIGALVAAHEKGIVHRDLKPENILIATDERGLVLPKIVDFGIAKLSLDHEKGSVTQSGVVLGSPDYMSPEQARGRADLDERTDVWSLAVVLYELVTGRIPFEGDNYNAQLAAILEDEPTPIADSGVANPELWGILEKGLAKDRAERFASMKELGVALAGWCVGDGIDTDVTGALVAVQWLEESRRPLSERPPSLDESRTAALAKRASLASGADLGPELQPASKVRSSDAPEAVRVPPVTPATELVSPLLEEIPVELAEPPKDTTLKSRAPPKSRGGGSALVALSVLGVAALAGGAWKLGLLRRWDPRAAPAATSVSAPPTSPATASVAATIEPAAVPPPASPVSASALAPLAARDPASVPACVAAHFGAGTFAGGAPAELGQVCAEADPRRGAGALKSSVVRASGKGVSEGMREWAMLKWYELPVFAVIRADCCPSPPPLKLPPPVGNCEPMDGALASITANAHGELDPSIARFRSAVSCIIASGVAADYSYSEPLRGGEETVFRRISARGGAAK